MEIVEGVRSASRLTTVLPVEKDDRIIWIDVAGYSLATSQRPTAWGVDPITTHTFRLNARKQEVTATRDV